MKKCPRCLKTKPLQEFPIDRVTTDGRGYNCKECKRKQSKELSDEKRREKELYGLY